MRSPIRAFPRGGLCLPQCASRNCAPTQPSECDMILDFVHVNDVEDHVVYLSSLFMVEVLVVERFAKQLRA